MDAQMLVCDSTADLNTNGFTKAGWSFTGWATTPSGDTVYSDEGTYTMGPGSDTLYAQWTANEYAITFDKNDSDATGSMDDQKLVCDSTADLIAFGFTKPGWSFLGWATTPSGDMVYTDGGTYTMGPESDTLYAKWEINSYTVRFDSRGGSAIDSQEVNYNSTVSEPSDPERKGCTFSGWFKDSLYVSEWDFSSNMVTDAITLYAKWTMTVYRIIYNGSGHTGGTPPDTGEYHYHDSAKVEEQGSLIKTGYTFTGWNTMADGSGTDRSAGSKFVVGASGETLYAQWVVMDIDGNVYTTVTIGTQTWLVENLKTSHFNDGQTIPPVTNDTSWSSIITPGYCWYLNDSTEYGDTYGALYNWYAVTYKNPAPEGWHVPTNEEWNTLTDFLGGLSEAGGKLKETGMEHWNSPNTGATNSSGFSALPGGVRSADGSTFYSIGKDGGWWSSTEADTGSAWNRHVHYDDVEVGRNYWKKRSGMSVRCIRDY
jgi:uncharacterized protein (TIGR02145 family)/uncharacterized repeat protein (TIGR02543 family)